MALTVARPVTGKIVIAAAGIKGPIVQSSARKSAIGSSTPVSGTPRSRRYCGASRSRADRSVMAP